MRENEMFNKFSPNTWKKKCNPHRTWRNKISVFEKGDTRLSKCRHFPINCGIVIYRVKEII